MQDARAARVVWRESADERAWVSGAVEAIAQALRDGLAGGDTWLLLSGGTTPGPVYRALPSQRLDWDHVTAALVDERDVDPDDEGSNARLVCRTLLHGRARAAAFRPLRDRGESLADAAARANAHWPFAPVAGPEAPLPRPSCAMAVLGLGDDGHTASLFPGAANLDAALASTEAYVTIDAQGCPVAGAWPRRISLTPAALGAARRRLLLIRGAGKRAVFERALAPGDARELPIRAAIDAPGALLEVHWCA